MAQQSEVNALDKQKQALMLRIAGVGYVKIAETLGYSGPSGAHKAVSSALKKTLHEPSEELRTLEMERLDAAAAAIYPSVRSGNFGAIDRWLRIMERRAKLLGLDRPILHDITSGGETISTIEIKPFNFETSIERIAPAVDDDNNTA